MSLTNEDLQKIRQITEEVSERVSERVTQRVVSQAVAGLATKDDVAALSARITATQADVVAVSAKVDQVKTMLEEDFRAESGRVTKIDGRLKKLRREFNHHVSSAPGRPAVTS